MAAVAGYSIYFLVPRNRRGDLRPKAGIFAILSPEDRENGRKLISPMSKSKDPGVKFTFWAAQKLLPALKHLANFHIARTLLKA